MGDYTNLSINLDLDLLKTGIPGIPGINLQGVVQLCKTTPLADACDGLNPVVDLLCGSLLKNTPLCASTGASSSSSKKNKTTAKAGGTLNRSAYGAPEAPQRSTGGGMPYLLLEGASQ